MLLPMSWQEYLSFCRVCSRHISILVILTDSALPDMEGAAEQPIWLQTINSCANRSHKSNI